MKRTHQLTVALLLPIAILFSVGLLNWESISYFTLRKVAQLYAGKADIALDIGSIGGNPFSETTLEHLALRPAKGEPQAYHFKAQSITCTYNLWDLKKSVEFFLQGLHCSAETPQLVQDISLSMMEDEAQSERYIFLLPAELPGLDLHNGSIILTNTGWDVEIRRINGRLQSSASTHELQLEADSFSFSQQGATKIVTGFASSMRYADKKLAIDSFEIGEEIRATGFIDLAQIDNGLTEFAANIAFTQSKLNFEGGLDKKLVKVYAGTENFDIGELQRRLGGAPWDISGKIRGKADLAVNLERLEELNGSFTVDVQEGQLNGVEIEALSSAGIFDNETFNVSFAEIRTPGNHILVKDISVPMSLLQTGEPLAIAGGSRVKFTVDVSDIPSVLKLVEIDQNKLPVLVRPSSLKINGYLGKGILRIDEAQALTTGSSLVINRAIIPIPASKEAFESVEIDLGARIENSTLQELARLFGNIPLNGEAAADISLSGTIKEPNAAISLSGENMHVREIELGSLAVQADVQLKQETLGTIKSVQFTITELTQKNNSGTIKLATPAAVSWQHDSLAISAMLKVDERGEVSVRLDGNPEIEMTGEIKTSRLDSSGWLKNFIDGRYFFQGAEIEAFFKGFPGSPQLQLAGIIEKAGAADVPFPLSGSFSLHYSPKGIVISEFSWKSLERSTLTMTGFLPYDPLAEKPFLKGNLSLAGQADFPSLEDIAILLEPWGIAKGSIDLDMDVTGSWNQPQGQILLQAKGIKPPDTLKQYADSPVDIICEIVAEGDSIFLKKANLESTQYSVGAKGFWRHGFSFQELMQGRKVELRGDVSGDANVQLKDLNFLRDFIPGLRRLEGDMRGELHVSGPINDPAVTGSFSLKDGEVSHSFNFPMLSALNLQGDFDEHSISISNMRAEVGGSPVNLTGSIRREKETAEVSLQITGQNVLLFRNNDMRMRGNVQLDVSGPLQRLVIKGTTGLTGGYYTRNIDFLGMIGSSAAPVSGGGGFLFSFQDPPLNKAVFDIKITTIEPFRIRNNLIRGVLRPELSLKGTGELPFLVGVVYIDPARVLLPSGRLRIQSGLLRFLEANPDRPEFDLIAQSKLLGYDINLITSGPLDDLVITLSSSPPLPNEDLMLLLLTGQPPRDDVTAGTQSNASTNVMLYLGRDFLNRWLDDESGAADETIFDRFDLDFGRDVTKSGDQTVETSFRLSEEITGQGRMYYLTGEKDRYDAYNYGLRLVFRFE